MARKPLNRQELLDISLRCAEVVHTYDGDAPTRVLVAASGLSERTFFRYFPTKNESIRPYLDAGSRTFAEALVRHVTYSVPTVLDAVMAALIEAFTQVRTPWGHHLMQLVLTVPSLRRVWLEANEDLAHLLLPTLAEALHLPEESAAARLVADQAVLLAVSSVRRMIHLGEAPQEAVSRVGDAFRLGLLVRPPQARETKKPH